MEMQTADALSGVIGGNAALVTLAFILAVCAIIATLGKAVDTVKGWIRPVRQKEDSVQDCLHADKKRLDAHDRRLGDLESGLRDTQDGQRVLMQGVMALLEHELHNGNSAQMEKASRDIQAHLLSK